MLRILAISTLAILILCTVPSVDASELYQWTDENGVTHFADSLEDVPEKYRDQVKVLGFDQDPEPTARGETATDDRPADALPASANEPSTDGDGAQLNRFEVPYEAYEGSSSRIIISVTFNNRVTAPMLLDTGAPGMVIFLELAEKLGVFSGNSGTLFTEAAGIGGTQEAILTIVDSVSVGDARDVFVPATVTASVSDAFQGLIGMDFVTNYTISIDSEKQVLVFQETPPKQNSRGGHDEAWWRKTFREFRSASDYWTERARALDGRADTGSANFVRFQAREAQELLQRLDLFASDNAVPRHWR